MDKHAKLEEIVERYSQPDLKENDLKLDGGIDPLWARFERSASNQLEDGSATVSRYAIWSNTVRDNIIEAMSLMNSGDAASAQYFLIRAANSLSAFSELQSYLDGSDQLD